MLHAGFCNLIRFEEMAHFIPCLSQKLLVLENNRNTRRFVSTGTRAPCRSINASYSEKKKECSADLLQLLTNFIVQNIKMQLRLD